VRAGRARPRAARLALLAWAATTALLVAFAPRGYAPLFVVAGIYLVGPLWIPVRYRVDDRGVERATAFGRRTWAWSELAAWRLDAGRRSAWLYPRGRGAARFLPPVLLLWEAGEGEGFAGRLEAALAGAIPSSAAGGGGPA
jgi:hypothetical protein